MIPPKLIETAIAIAIAAAMAGQLPKFIQGVRLAQYQVLKESRTSNWGKPLLLPIK